MVNFDMVGRMRDDRVIVYGVATAAEMRDIVSAANAPQPLNVSAVGDGFGPSDQSSFYARDLPVLHFFTDVHPDYHRASDDADRINAAGAIRVVDLAERAVRAIADRPTRLTFTRAPTTARAASPASQGAYFGSIPDMGAADDNGMRLTGVSPGGPAEKAGIKGGDVIVEFGGKPVKNIYDYTDAIGAFKPGDVVTVVVLRGPTRERLSIQVTLGRRGG
jgi:membrane-associated protease RseP (regulator of RpoE activity)